MSQNSIVIFRSCIDAIAELPAELYREVSQILYAYAFDGIEPGEGASPTARALFIALKPQIDFNVARYERAIKNGSKGGAPKGTKNNPNGRSGKRTNQELTQNKPKTNQELTNAEKLVISDVEAVEVEVLEADEDSEKTQKTPEKRQKRLDKTNQELTQNKPKTNQEGEKELTDGKKLTLISNQLSINNNSDVVVDGAHAREDSFLKKFFSPENQYGLEVFCQNHTADLQTVKAYAQEIMGEWQLRGESHTDYKEFSRHLINHLRKKFEADRRAQREADTAPKSRRQAREDLIRGAIKRLNNTIRKDGGSPTTAGDTKPF